MASKSPLPATSFPIPQATATAPSPPPGFFSSRPPPSPSASEIDPLPGLVPPPTPFPNPSFPQRSAEAFRSSSRSFPFRRARQRRGVCFRVLLSGCGFRSLNQIFLILKLSLTNYAISKSITRFQRPPFHPFPVLSTPRNPPLRKLGTSSSAYPSVCIESPHQLERNRSFGHPIQTNLVNPMAFLTPLGFYRCVLCRYSAASLRSLSYCNTMYSFPKLSTLQY